MSSKCVALLAANPAWLELTSQYVAHRGYKCLNFMKVESLSIFTRISPAHIIVLDPDPDDLDLLSAVRQLKMGAPAYPLFQSIGLTKIHPGFHQPLIASGLDLVIQKPVGSNELVRHIDDLIAHPPRRSANRGPQRQSDKDNVVYLFP